MQDRPGWQTELRVSRRAGLELCVMELLELRRRRGALFGTSRFLIYREVAGQPVGEPIAAADDRGEAQALAECLGDRGRFRGLRPKPLPALLQPPAPAASGAGRDGASGS